MNLQQRRRHRSRTTDHVPPCAAVVLCNRIEGLRRFSLMAFCGSIYFCCGTELGVLLGSKQLPALCPLQSGPQSFVFPLHGARLDRSLYCLWRPTGATFHPESDRAEVPYHPSCTPSPEVTGHPALPDQPIGVATSGLRRHPFGATGTRSPRRIAPPSRPARQLP